jgi:hypothetical protein
MQVGANLVFAPPLAMIGIVLQWSVDSVQQRAAMPIMVGEHEVRPYADG